MDADGISNLSVAKLQERCDPFTGCCWSGLDKPITIEEVTEALDKNNLTPPQSYASGKDNDDRKRHAERIAWFVLRGWNTPIGVDVGVPTMGCCPAWPVVDGNHRLAAAIYRGNLTIRAEVSGAVEEINTLIFEEPMTMSSERNQ